MKILYQSLSSYRYEPVWDDYGKGLEEQCKRVLRPDTEMYATGIPVMVREIDKYKSSHYYHKTQVLNNMFKAEKEDFDAFTSGYTLDSVLEEGREMMSMPVVSISQTSYYLAAMLGKLFATVTIAPHFCGKYRQPVEHYSPLPYKPVR